MRRIGVIVTAVLISALLTSPASAARGSWNNWHVHDGGTGMVDSTGLTHRGVAVFPTILGVSIDVYKASPGLWAYCPDATDKFLVGGDGGAKDVAGQCRNETSIIHLQGIESGDSAPSGWTAMTPGSFIPGFTIYFRLTSR